MPICKVCGEIVELSKVRNGMCEECFSGCEVEFRPLPKNTDGRKQRTREYMERNGVSWQTSLS